MPEFKNSKMKIKASGGTISGYFSTYDVEADVYGDMIEKGAFEKTLKAREESGHPFPLCWNHDLNQIIGTVSGIEDTEKGPLMTAKFFDAPLAQEKREIALSGCVYQFSFAYDAVSSRKPTDEEKKLGITRVLTEVNLYEVSIVPIPANQNAVVTEIKSGKRNSKADEGKIKQAISLLSEVIGEAEEDEAEKTEEEAKEVNAAAKEQKSLNEAEAVNLEYIKKWKNGGQK